MIDKTRDIQIKTPSSDVYGKNTISRGFAKKSKAETALAYRITVLFIVHDIRWRVEYILYCDVTHREMLRESILYEQQL